MSTETSGEPVDLDPLEFEGFAFRAVREDLVTWEPRELRKGHYAYTHDGGALYGHHIEMPNQ